MSPLAVPQTHGFCAASPGVGQPGWICRQGCRSLAFSIFATFLRWHSTAFQTRSAWPRGWLLPGSIPRSMGSVPEGRWPRAGHEPSFSPLAGRRTRRDATGAGSFRKSSRRDLPGGHTSPRRILQEFLLSRWADEQHLKTCTKGRGSVTDPCACTDFLWLQPAERFPAPPAWAAAPALLPTRKDPLRCKHSLTAHLEVPPTAHHPGILNPSILTLGTAPRARAQCPAPFAFAAQTWLQTPPFAASTGGRLLLRRWEHSGKKPVPCRRGLLRVSRSLGSHLHPAGKQNSQHPANKAVFNH